jgi:hypothetical protein
MIHERCIIRRVTLPIFPCDKKDCDWYIRNSDCNNCFWILSEIFADGNLSGLDFDEIAELEGIAVEEAYDIYETALAKCRLSIRKFIKKI